LVTTVSSELEVALSRSVLLRDAIGRDPRTRGQASEWPVLVELGVAVREASPAWAERAPLRVAIGEGRLVLDALVEPSDPDAIERVAEQLSTLLGAAVEHREARCGDLPVVGPAEAALLDELNRTELDHDRSATIDALFRAQVARTPDAPALS